MEEMFVYVYYDWFEYNGRYIDCDFIRANVFFWENFAYYAIFEYIQYELSDLLPNKLFLMCCMWGSWFWKNINEVVESFLLSAISAANKAASSESVGVNAYFWVEFESRMVGVIAFIWVELRIVGFIAFIGVESELRMGVVAFIWVESELKMGVVAFIWVESRVGQTFFSKERTFFSKERAFSWVLLHSL